MSSPVRDEESLREAYETVRSDANDTNWFVFKYDGTSIVKDSLGSDFDEFRSKFGDDERGYGYLRVMCGDRAKFAFVTWIGPRVSPLEKAKVSPDKAFVKKIVDEFAQEFLFVGDFTLDHITDTLKKASGEAYGTGK